MKKTKIIISCMLSLVMSVGMFVSLAVIHVEATDSSTNVAIFRLYNPNSGEHFYTPSQGERDSLIMAGWNGEGYAWMSPSSSNVPVYRVYSSGTGDHHYTINAVERDMLVASGWNDEGIGWYSSETNAIPVYRQFNPNCTGAGSHNYTVSAGEASSLISVGWNDEGIGWYGVNASYPPYPVEPERRYGPFTESQITSIKQELKVPLDINVEITVGNPSYWEGAGIWTSWVKFTDGVHVASANCDVETGGVAKNIQTWTDL